MKKVKVRRPDELRKEYKRSDFGPMVRGKYAARINRASNVIVLEPEIAQAFPNDQAVNDTLRSPLELAKSTRTLRKKTSRAVGTQR